MSCLKKCWDTRCFTKRTTRSTKQQFIKLFDDEIYPIGERYAYLIATFFISLAFCGVIPILIPVALVSFFLLYVADKFLLFKYYQTPIQYSPALHKVFLKVLYFSIMIHFGVTALLLAEPTLIANGAYIGTTFSSVVTGNGRIANVFRTGYILPYFLMFVFMLVFAIFRQFIAKAIIACL